MSVVVQVEHLSKYYRLGLIGGGTLNGTILGMTRPEVTRKLDEIVEFAEMAQFIDTPVKRYSSGMTVRLAFAVAAQAGEQGPMIISAAQHAFIDGWVQSMWLGVAMAAVALVYLIARGPARTPAGSAEQQREVVAVG